MREARNVTRNDRAIVKDPTRHRHSARSKCPRFEIHDAIGECDFVHLHRIFVQDFVREPVKAAVELALKGHNSVMPTIARVSDKPYKWKIGTADLSKVANVEKMLPRDYITPDGFHITAKGRRYLAPLIKGEDYPPYKDGLPQYVVLKNVAVRKKLSSEFKL